MKSFLIALQFLTRIHLTDRGVWSDTEFGASILWFPLVGTLTGCILAALNGTAAFLFSPLLTAGLTVAAWYCLTGGLHADGFMDTADGIFSGRSRERMLEILKDSRVGSTGVTAFFFLAVFKIFSLVEILSPWQLLVAVPAATRFAALFSILKFPYARSEGLGKAFGQYAPPHALRKSLAVNIVPLLLVGVMYIPVLMAAVIITVFANRYICKRLGGVTGDTYGAVIEFTEAVLLVGAAAVLRCTILYI